MCVYIYMCIYKYIFCLFIYSFINKYIFTNYYRRRTIGIGLGGLDRTIRQFRPQY